MMIYPSDLVFTRLMQISGVKARKAKINLLMTCPDNEFLQLIIQWALDPYITFGITRRAETSTWPAGKNQFDDKTFELLQGLSERTLTGNAAEEAVLEHVKELTIESRELFWRIISKDLRCGAANGIVSSIWPWLLSSFEVMKAHPLEEKRLEFPYIVEPKLDGLRTTVIVDLSKGLVEFKSLTGHQFTSQDRIKEFILSNVDPAIDYPFILDGELISGGFNETVSQVRKKELQSEDSVLHLFDCLPLEDFHKGFYEKSLVRRRSKLLEMFKHDGDHPDALVKFVPQNMVFDKTGLDAFYKQYLSDGLEGLMVKDPDSPYHCKRSFHWMKVKAEETIDVPIVGAEKGTGKNSEVLGALIVQLPSGVQVKVGGGFSDKLRKEIWGEYLDGGLEGRIIEVEYQLVTEDGSLRHPRFVRFRDTHTDAKE